MSTEFIGVLIVEDHLVFAQALTAVLNLEPDIEVVGVVGRASDSVHACLRYRPDVVIVDLDLPGGDGQEAVEAMRGVSPETRFLVLTAVRDEVELGRAVEAGVSAMLHKSTDVVAIVEAVRRVAAGESLLAPDVSATLLRELRVAREQDWRAVVARESLTGRELDVLSRLAQAMPVETIASELGIRPATVETHLKNIRAKLGVTSRLEAVVEAFRLGLVEPPDRLPDSR